MVIQDIQEAISLYFHIPFCTKKCDYCHFYVIPDKAPFHTLLMEGFALDMAQWSEQLKNKKLVSIYFGGGTPSLLGPEAIFLILNFMNNTIIFYFTFKRHQYIQISKLLLNIRN